MSVGRGQRGVTAMSHRGKRPTRLENDAPPPIKRRKGRPPTAATATSNQATSGMGGSGGNGCATSPDGEGGGAGASSSKCSGSWQPKPNTDIKNIYNRTAPEAPAELFR